MLMAVRKVPIKKLSNDVQSFLSQVRPGQGLVVEDENGRAKYGVIPFEGPTAAEQAKAWKELRQLQKEARQAMAAQGITEDDVMRVVLEDD
jgi:hypothetical protein